jgi:hypothetical protein
VTQATHRIAILGDSRVFDTYYATAVYGATAYGYHKTFPHVLQRMLARRAEVDIDCVHIPDHFRGRTVQNNILRLALTDPSAVVLCDGIWESLISKRHFIEHVEQVIGDATAETGAHCFTYSEDSVVDLFERNKLALSPNAYADRVATIASWFVRRRRKVVWLTTPIPPRDHLGGLHYAGSYRPFAGWHRCLEILNRETSRAAVAAGAEVLDLDALMREHGGASACLIDQWHFSAAFHRVIAEWLAQWSLRSLTSLPPAASSRVMVQGMTQGLAVHLIGPAEPAQTFMRAHPSLIVRGHSASFVDDDRYSEVDALILLAPPSCERMTHARALLRQCPERLVVLFPEDLAPMDNPPGADRAAFGSFK